MLSTFNYQPQRIAEVAQQITPFNSTSSDFDDDFNNMSSTDLLRNPGYLYGSVFTYKSPTSKSVCSDEDNFILKHKYNRLVQQRRPSTFLLCNLILKHKSNRLVQQRRLSYLHFNFASCNSGQLSLKKSTQPCRR